MPKKVPVVDARTFTPCGPAEYPALLRLLDTAFKKPEKNWFAKYYCHIFRNEPSWIKNNYIVRIDGELAGAIGIYPLKLKVGKTVLSVGGVGSVSTLPEFRGKGVMSFMLENVIQRMEAGNFDISWLAGDRYRYGNYGWEKGGRIHLYTIGLRDIPRRFPDLPPVQMRKAKSQDIPTLAALYRTFECGIVRSTKDWKTRLARKGFDVYLAQSGRAKAYMVVERRKSGGDVIEIQGHPATALAMVARFLKRENVNSTTVRYPAKADSMGQALFTVANNFTIDHRGQFRIVKTESTWVKVLPEIEKAHGYLPSKQIRTLRTVTREKDMNAILHRVFGYFDNTPPLPTNLKKFEWVRPIGWWFSDFDSV